MIDNLKITSVSRWPSFFFMALFFASLQPIRILAQTPPAVCPPVTTLGENATTHLSLAPAGHLNGTKIFMQTDSPIDLETPPILGMDRPDINLETAEKLAVAKARSVYGGTPVVYSTVPLRDPRGKLIAYCVDVSLTGIRPAGFWSVAHAWNAYLAGPKREAYLKAKDPRAFVPDRNDQPYSYFIVSATYDSYPVLLSARAPSTFVYLGSSLLSQAKEILGSEQARLAEIIPDSGWSMIYLFESQGRSIAIEGHEPWLWFQGNDFKDIGRQRMTVREGETIANYKASGLDYEKKVVGERQANQRAATILLESTATADAPCERTCMPPCNCIPDVFSDLTPLEWHYGCAPTAAAMVLDYYDNHLHYGLLTGDYFASQDPHEGDYDCHVSQSQLSLSSIMHTTSTGITQTNDIYPGMNDYCNGLGYSFAEGVNWSSKALPLPADPYHWADIVGEIDDGHPFVWTDNFSWGEGGHSVAAVGYDASTSDVLAYDTWWTDGQKIVRRYYKSSDTNAWAYGAGPHPTSGNGDYFAKLMSPKGSDLWPPNCTYKGTVREGEYLPILWDNHGHPADKVSLYYSTAGGLAPITIGDVRDLGFYPWLVPYGAATNQARIGIIQLDASGNILSQDGSYGDFQIIPCPQPAIPTAVSPADNQTFGLGTTAVDLLWNCATNSDFYDVYLTDGATRNYLGRVNDAPIHATVIPGHSYSWEVVAGVTCNSANIASSGVHPFSVQSSCAAPGSFSQTYPSDTQPVGNTSVVNLTWSASAGADSYDVYWSQTNPPTLAGPQTGTTFAAGVAAGSTYYWRVVAKVGCNSSLTYSTPVRSFSVQTTCSAPGSFSLTSPSANYTFGATTTQAQLSWGTSANADSYDVYFSTDPSPQYLTTQPGTSKTVPVTAGQTYYWKVVAKVSCNGALTSTAGPSQFQVQGGCLPPGDFSLVQPPNGSSMGNTTTSLQLTWTASPYADVYYVYFGTSSNPPLLDGNVAGTSKTVNVSAGITYYWRVVAHVNCDSSNTKSSAIWSFTVQQSCNPPGNITLAAPVDGASVPISYASTLTWNPSAGATSYDLYFGTSASPTLYNSYSTTYANVAVAVNTTYYWKVVARTSCNSAYANYSETRSFSVTADCGPPVAFALNTPANGQAVSANGSATLSWQVATGAASYDVYFGPSSPPSFYVNQTGTTLPVSVSAGNTYYWRVRANASCDSTYARWSPTWSFSVTSDCNQPGNFSLSSPSNGINILGVTSVSLIWSPSSGADSYDVYFGTSPSPPLVNTQATTVLPAIVSPGMTYYWKVVSRVNCDSSKTVTSGPWSFSVSNQPVCTAPGWFQLSSPDNAQLFSSGTTSVSLSWVASPGADSYDIYYGTSSNPTLYASQPATQTTKIVPVTAGTTYYWKVTARVNCDSNLSTQNDGGSRNFTIASVCEAPAALSLSSPSNSASLVPTTTTTLSWSESANADYYNIYLGTTSPPSYLTTVLPPSTSALVNVSPGSTYYWEVQARSQCTSAYTSAGPQSFSVQPTSCAPPEAFSLFSPSQNAIMSPPITSQVLLQWDPAQGANDYYDIYFGTTNPPPFYCQSSSPSATNQIVNVTPGNLYYWKVVAHVSCGTGMTTSTSVWQFNVAASSTCDTPQAFRLSQPPDGFVAGTGTTAMDLSWTPPSTSPDYYDVYFGTTTSPSLVTTLPANSSHYTVTVAPGQTYYWKVVGRKDCTTYWYIAGPRSFSVRPCNPMGSFSPVSPENGTTLLSTPSSVTLSWSSSSYAEGYNIYFGTSSTPPYVATVPEPTTNYQVTVNPGTTYYWRVTAGESCLTDALATATWSFDVARACPGASLDALPTTPTVGLGVPYLLSGTVTSGYAITNVTLKITKPDGSTDQSVTASPYATSYSLANMTIPSSVLTLLGSYAIEVWVKTGQCTAPSAPVGIFTLTVINSSGSCAYWGEFGGLQLSGTDAPGCITNASGKAYVTRGQKLTVLDLSTNTEGANISFSSGWPKYPAVSGNRAYVPLSGLGSNGKLGVVNLDTNSVLTTVTIGSEPYAVAAYNSKLYVAMCNTSGTVLVLDASTYAVLKTITVGASPRYIVADSSGNKAYVVNRAGNSVSVIDLTTDAVTTTIATTHTNPYALAITGGKAYVVASPTSSTGYVDIINLATNTVIGSITVQNQPLGISGMTGKVFVGNFNSSSVSVIDTATDTITSTVTIGGQPSDITTDSSSGTTYAACGNRWVSVVKNTTPAPAIASFSPGSGPVGTSVVLSGTNFGCCSSIAFNGTGATSFTVTSATSITVQVPAGATTGPITVATPGGAYTSAVNFVVSNNVAPTEASPSGQPAIWTKGAGSAVHVNYTSGCNATDDTIYWGASSGSISSLSWVGQACHLGTNGASSFDPGTPSSGSFMYFVIVANDGTKEGSYGKNSSGQERPAASALAGCTYTQDLSGTCN